MLSPLFAVEEATVLGVLMAALAMLGGGWASYMGYLTTKTKAQFDTDSALMRSRVTSLEQDVENCHKDRDAQKAARDLQIAELTRRVDECSKGHKALQDYRGVEDTR